MNSSDNLTSLANYEQWMFQPTAAYPDSWLTEDFTRDAETLTRALQKTISSDTNSYRNSDAGFTSSDAVSSFCKGDQQQQSASGVSGSDAEMAATATGRRAAATVTTTKAVTGGATKKITKRKPRATKKCQTTFIMADPANFRQMVQQVTGVRFETLQQQNNPNQLIVKPEPKRLTGTNLPLPTLDTSSFFVDHSLTSQLQLQQGEGGGFGIGGGQRGGSLTGNGDTVGHVAYGDSLVGGGSGTGFGYESYQSFPTLESWKVMCDF